MGNYEIAVGAALFGPERKELMLSNHEFNVKPFDERMFNDEGNRLTVKGQISHCLFGQIDDQVHYVIEVAPGAVLSIQRWVAPTTMLKTIFKAGHLGGSIITSVFAPPLGSALLNATDKVTETAEWIRANIVGDWLPVCESLIALIAIAAADELAVVNEPPPSRSYSKISSIRMDKILTNVPLIAVLSYNFCSSFCKKSSDSSTNQSFLRK